MKNRYRKGDDYVVCDRTNRKLRRSQMAEEWNGSFVGKDVWEQRHPQDRIKVYYERTSVSPTSLEVEQVMGETIISDFC